MEKTPKFCKLDVIFFFFSPGNIFQRYFTFLDLFLLTCTHHYPSNPVDRTT